MNTTKKRRKEKRQLNRKSGEKERFKMEKKAFNDLFICARATAIENAKEENCSAKKPLMYFFVQSHPLSFPLFLFDFLDFLFVLGRKCIYDIKLLAHIQTSVAKKRKPL